MKILFTAIFLMILYCVPYAQVLSLDEMVFLIENTDSIAKCEKFLAKKGYFRMPNHVQRKGFMTFYFNLKQTWKNDKIVNEYDAGLICSTYVIIISTKHRWIYDYFELMGLSIDKHPEPAAMKSYDEERLLYAKEPILLSLTIKDLDVSIDKDINRKYSISLRLY